MRRFVPVAALFLGLLAIFAGAVVFQRCRAPREISLPTKDSAQSRLGHRPVNPKRLLSCSRTATA